MTCSKIPFRKTEKFVNMGQDATGRTSIIYKRKNILTVSSICNGIIYLNFSVEELLPDFMKNPNDFAISSNLKQKLDIEDEEKVLEQLAILEQAISPFIITVRKYLFLFYF